MKSLGYQDKALADADAALAVDPENPVALQAKGLVEFHGGAYAAAASHLCACRPRWTLLPALACSGGRRRRI